MNRTQIMVSLLVALCIAVAYAWIAMPKQHRILPEQSFQRQTEQQKDSPASFPVINDLDFSSSEETPYQKPQKNLFAPLYLAPKVAQPRSIHHPIVKVAKAFSKPRKTIPDIMPLLGSKSIQPLDVLGYLSKAGEYTVFLSSKQGKEIFLVKAGDVFAGNLIVLSINDKNITIGQRQTDQQVTLPLTEAKSQRLPRIEFQSGRPEFKMVQEPQPMKQKPVRTPSMNKLDKKQLLKLFNDKKRQTW